MRVARVWWVGLGLALVAGAVAFLARLLPVLRGGGLAGIGNYDDGVYYAAGTALAHGLLPYRDFVFLHPPGAVLATWPFGLVAGLAGDPAGLTAARLTWMLLGAINCVLVGRIVWSMGMLPAALAASYYAFSGAAVYTEWTTQLVAPAQTCVLLAILLLARGGQGERSITVPVVAAGALLGASATFKIWGVAAVVAALIWLLVRRQWRSSLLLTAGAAGAVTAICLPFFLAAPGRMWLMVVEAQLGRPPARVPPATRLAGIIGLNLEEPRITTFGLGLVLALALVVALLVAAAWIPEARLPLTLTAVLSAVLLTGPSWFLHYPGFVAGPLAVSLGFGAAQVIRSVSSVPGRSWLGLLASAALAVPVVASAIRQRDLAFGTAFPGGRFAAQVAGVDGCVTADDLTVLAGMNVLSRNLDRRCRFVADFSGYSYVFAVERGRSLARARDAQWQAMYVDYLRTGEYSLVWRYPRADALAPATRETVTSWPRVLRVESFSLRDPARTKR
jgi:alpha-1,2-mannosyltransferase